MHNSVRGAPRAAPHSRSRPRIPAAEQVAAIGVSLLLLLALPQPLVAQEFKAGDIEIVQPWSRAVPEGAKVAAGYVTIRNGGPASDRLVSASAEIAGKAEIHEMAVDANGVMTMRPLPDGVEVAPAATVELKPGSFHIMFMDLAARPADGGRFKGTLTFEKAGTIDVEFDVQAMGDGGAGHGG